MIKKISTLLTVFLTASVMLMGCSGGSDSGSRPEDTVKAFLDEVNEGNIQGGKLYFSGEYAGGYDQYDEDKLNTLFPPGSIQEVTFKNVETMGDRATVTAIIKRNGQSDYETSLILVKKSGQWKIDYDGFSWPFQVK